MLRGSKNKPWTPSACRALRGAREARADGDERRPRRGAGAAAATAGVQVIRTLHLVYFITCSGSL
jgi:hypothetical protein